MTYAHSGHAGACTAEPYNGILLEEHKVISPAFAQENDLFLEEKTKPATVRETSDLWQRQYNCKVHHGSVDIARPQAMPLTLRASWEQHPSTLRREHDHVLTNHKSCDLKPKVEATTPGNAFSIMTEDSRTLQPTNPASTLGNPSLVKVIKYRRRHDWWSNKPRQPKRTDTAQESFLFITRMENVRSRWRNHCNGSIKRQTLSLSERTVVMTYELRTVRWPSQKLRNERQNNFRSELQTCVETRRDPNFKRQISTIFNNRTTTNGQIKDIDCLPTNVGFSLPQCLSWLSWSQPTSIATSTRNPSRGWSNKVCLPWWICTQSPIKSTTCLKSLLSLHSMSPIGYQHKESTLAKQ